MAAVMEATRIGRFEIVSTLGRGAQGTVYLGRDTRLGRRVAIKTLRMDRLDAASRHKLTTMLLDEARIVGKLSHPNIVPLFDAFEEDDLPYLVFEFVEGRTLGDMIRERGSLDPHEAARIALGLLAGVDAAHEAGVVHRDLKPANIMMTREGVARVMDFGIASHTDGTESAPEGLAGTPSYMAPEYIAGAAFTPRCDVFAAGMVLYEMLTGAPAVRGANHYETMFAMTREAFARPSTRNAAVDEKLEAVVMRALEKDPQARYASIADLVAALKDWVEPRPADRESGGAAGGGVLEFLLRRMRYKSDFPVLSSTISTVNNLVASENGRTGALADSILKDVSLTNKLLRMVNTAYFQQFGGSVSTVSRAVSILGFQKVRNAALSLMLFEHLQNKAQAADLKDQVTGSYFSGVISRDLVDQLKIKNAEEAFICSMFHRLGKLLAVFYLHEESREVTRVAQARNVDEDVAAVEVLGISYSDLGLGVAKQWNLPERIVSSMKPPAGNQIASDEGRMRAIADASNRLADAVRAPQGKARDAALAKIESDYGRALGLERGAIDKLLGQGAETFLGEVKSLGLPVGGGTFMQGLRSIGPGVEAASAAAGGAGAGGATRAPAPSADRGAEVSRTTGGAAADGDATLVDGIPAQAAAPAAVEPAIAETMLNTVTPDMNLAAPSEDPRARAQMLTAGIQDITNSLAGDYQLNDVLRIILETMYRAIGFTRVMLCTRDPKHNALRARLGFGAEVDAIIKHGFIVPLESSKDVFYGAISKGADVCIEDRDSERIRPYIPDWYRSAVSARGFVLFPVVVNKKPVGLIYADHDEAGRLKFADGELNLLKTLRNQAILAIRQKS